MERPPRRPVEISTGLLEPRHLRALRKTLPLYFVLLSQTPIGSHWVRGKRPLPISELSRLTGFPRSTVQVWLKDLEASGYIVVRRPDGEGESGMGARGKDDPPPVIGIVRRKWWRGAREIVEDPANPPAPCQPAGTPPANGLAPPLPTSGQAHGNTLSLVFSSSPEIKSTPENRSRGLPEKSSSPRERDSQANRHASDEDLDAKKVALWTRYRDKEDQVVLREAFARVNRARRSGRASLHVLVRILEDLDRYEIPDVVDGAERFLDRELISGQPENYWLGCVRGAKREREEHERATEEA